MGARGQFEGGLKEPNLKVGLVLRAGGRSNLGGKKSSFGRETTASAKPLVLLGWVVPRVALMVIVWAGMLSTSP